MLKISWLLWVISCYNSMFGTSRRSSHSVASMKVYEGRSRQINSMCSWRSVSASSRRQYSRRMWRWKMRLNDFQRISNHFLLMWPWEPSRSTWLDSRSRQVPGPVSGTSQQVSSAMAFYKCLVDVSASNWLIGFPRLQIDCWIMFKIDQFDIDGHHEVKSSQAEFCWDCYPIPISSYHFLSQ